jgi:RNA polymerase sigma factor (sigma-70 family)
MMTGVAAGSQEAVWQLAETYTPHIIRAVRASLPRSVRIKLDSQDFAQILWASLLLGDTDLTRLKSPEQLIGFLAAAAKNKVLFATRRYLRTQKRDVAREQRIDDVAKSTRGDFGKGRDVSAASMSRGPTPSELASVHERWRRVLSDATERDRRILQLRLERRSFESISEELKIHQSTARRAIQQLIQRFSE